MLRELAREFHVETLVVRGEYGLIAGPATDNVIMRWYAINGVWAEATNRLVAERLAGGGTFVDVGANVGMTTIPAAGLPGVSVVALEPDPICYRHLVTNVATNRAGADVRLENVAAYDRACELQLEVSDVNHGDNRIRGRNEPGALQEHDRAVVPVRAVALDEYLGSLGGPIFVKIDTQGAEPFVVAGAARLLATAKTVLFEYWPYGMRRLDADPAVLHELLDQFDTVSIRTETGETKAVSPAEALARLNALDAPDTEAYVDVILTRG